MAACPPARGQPEWRSTRLAGRSWASTRRSGTSRQLLSYRVSPCLHACLVMHQDSRIVQSAPHLSHVAPLTHCFACTLSENEILAQEALQLSATNSEPSPAAFQSALAACGVHVDGCYSCLEMYDPAPDTRHLGFSSVVISRCWRMHRLTCVLAFLSFSFARMLGVSLRFWSCVLVHKDNVTCRARLCCERLADLEGLAAQALAPQRWRPQLRILVPERPASQRGAALPRALLPGPLRHRGCLSRIYCEDFMGVPVSSVCLCISIARWCFACCVQCVWLLAGRLRAPRRVLVEMGAVPAGRSPGRPPVPHVQRRLGSRARGDVRGGVARLARPLAGAVRCCSRGGGLSPLMPARNPTGTRLRFFGTLAGAVRSCSLREVAACPPSCPPATRWG